MKVTQTLGRLYFYVACLTEMSMAFMDVKEFGTALRGCSKGNKMKTKGSAKKKEVKGEEVRKIARVREEKEKIERKKEK